VEEKAKQLQGLAKTLSVNCYNFESKYVKLEEGYDQIKNTDNRQLHSSLKVRDHISHPYKNWQIIVF